MGLRCLLGRNVKEDEIDAAHCDLNLKLEASLRPRSRSETCKGSCREASSRSSRSGLPGVV